MYIERVVDAELAESLEAFGAVLVEGPKWCGKTTSSSRHAASELRIADPSGNYQNRRLAQLDVMAALAGDRPRLVDEWQEAPATWDAVRYLCDEAGGTPGQFILTGSATPHERNRPVHSGAGRIGRVRMDTLTLQEMGISTGESSLSALFNGEPSSGFGRASVKDVAAWVCHGGWPAAVNLDVRQSQRIALSYLDAVANEDLERMDGVSRDPRKVRRVIASLARNEATLATKKTIVADASEQLGSKIAESTVSDYLAALGNVFFTDDVPAWDPALRSPVRIRSARKRHMADSSLAAAALGATPQSLLADLKTLGFLFESLVTHDLMVYARANDARVSHYQDDSGLEVDLIVQRSDGEWAPVEVKLGSDQENAGATSVCALERKMTERGERRAAFKAVVVGVGGIAHLREDGVVVIPIDTLGV